MFNVRGREGQVRAQKTNESEEDRRGYGKSWEQRNFWEVWQKETGELCL